MIFVLVFLLALAAAVVGITVFLSCRERARRLRPDGTDGLLIEQQRTAQAAYMRTAYTSRSVHHGTGLAAEEVYRHHS
ncbi:hypothetical protein [Streptomyces sp. NRRL S-350]|uniref:hypothetical protein n=1 Tax=Streptomyces sp. NRRL S-350 TaxID=1463902 RepID=UPI0004C119BD|nr:hypothetical protein [Streptomyces sp. NRRL S-350]